MTEHSTITILAHALSRSVICRDHISDSPSIPICPASAVCVRCTEKLPEDECVEQLIAWARHQIGETS